MHNILLIAFGGALGSVLRYGISILLPLQVGFFPKATFVSNVLSSLLVGILAGLLLSKFHNEHWLKYFLLIGFCGGFSTFSSYALELYNLNFNGAYLTSLAYAISAIVASVLAVFCGLYLSKIIT